MTRGPGAISDNWEEVSEKEALEARSGLYKNPNGLKVRGESVPGEGTASAKSWRLDWLVLYSCCIGEN